MRAKNCIFIEKSFEEYFHIKIECTWEKLKKGNTMVLYEKRGKCFVSHCGSEVDTVGRLRGWIDEMGSVGRLSR